MNKIIISAHKSTINVLGYIHSSLCGFSNAVVFRLLTNESVSYLEQFVHEKIKKVIDIDDNEKIHFYGMWHKKEEEFCIQLGDRLLLIEIAAYVNRTLESKGASYFQSKCKLPRTELNKTRILSCGRFYASNQNDTVEATVEQTKRQRDDKQLLTKLHERASALLIADKSDDMKEFSTDMVKIWTNGTKINGQNICYLCRKENVEKLVRVSYYISTNTEYWIFSNFAKHLRKINAENGSKKLLLL